MLCCVTVRSELVAVAQADIIYYTRHESEVSANRHGAAGRADLAASAKRVLIGPLQSVCSITGWTVEYNTLNKPK